MIKKAKILAVAILLIFLGSKNVSAAELTYTVKTGDSLWKIAVKHGLTVDKLKKINNLTSDLLFPGQVLIVSSNSCPSSSNSDSNLSDNNAVNQEANAAYYVVQAGDNLWKIAREYGMTVEELKRLNNLTSDCLNIGDRLLVKTVNSGSAGLNNIAPSRAGNLLDGERIIEFASRHLGTPYRYGGSSPGGFDCSGFVYYVFNQFGISLPRTAADQFQRGTAVSRDELITGDLVFFSCYSRGIDHVGIYVGEGKFIHSSSPRSGGVIYSSLDESYYARSYVGAKRILR